MAEETPQGRQEDIYYRPEVGAALRQDYERYDERWKGASQARDWAILIGIGVLQFLWMLIVFLFEPGIR
jgi:hypothetical protein